MEAKIISIEEANRMLPLMRGIVADIMSKWKAIIEKRAELECLEKNSRDYETGCVAADSENALRDVKLELNNLIDRINSYIREVENLGCFVEEFKRGVVNFPSLCNGRKVFLCWQPGDLNVGYWHELDETFNDRLAIRDYSEFLCHPPVHEGRG